VRGSRRRSRTSGRGCRRGPFLANVSRGTDIELGLDNTCGGDVLEGGEVSQGARDESGGEECLQEARGDAEVGHSGNKLSSVEFSECWRQAWCLMTAIGNRLRFAIAFFAQSDEKTEPGVFDVLLFAD